MEKRLESLKNDMNETLLKDAEFNMKSKQAVLNSLRKRPRPLRTHFWKQSLNIAFTGLLFAGVLLFAYTKVQDRTPVPDSFSAEKTDTHTTGTQNDQLTKYDTFQNTAKRSKGEESAPPETQDKTAAAAHTPRAYVVFDGYYYEKTGDSVDDGLITEKVGEVKRIGDWEIVRDGDSNEIAPGPLFAVKGRKADEYIAGKGVIYENGENKAAYLLFKRSVPVAAPDKTKIFNAKNDPEEVSIALKNAREASGGFYELLKEGIEPTLVSYSDRPGKQVMLYYRFMKSEDEVIFINQFYNDRKNSEYPSSRFSKDNRSKEPKVIEDFTIGKINWTKYQDFNHNEYFYVGHSPKWTLEVSFQGDFDLVRTKSILGELKY
jgi:hypothetical protein